jgi:xanthine dehydrogenase molybdenum-binding subunit
MATVNYERNVVLSSKNYDVIGTRPVRHDGADKVTGRAIYGADFDTAGLLFGKILRSPHAHARIVSIDTSAAEALSGVHAVVTSADFPEIEGGALVSDGEGGFTDVGRLRDNVLAGSKALYKGHAIAGVAASSSHVAEEAISLINVKYEVLAPVMTAPQGMEENAPILLEDLETEELGATLPGPTNVAQHIQHVKGDIAKGFADADIIVEREFNTATVHQGYIEPHAASAFWSSDGRLHIWTCTQGSFAARDSTAEILGLSTSQVRVTPTEIGGGFGGKINVYLEPVAGLLSQKSARAVKIAMSRADVFEGSGPTPGSYVKIKMGAKKDGTLTAGEAYLAYEAGAFPGSAIAAGADCVFTAYDLGNQLIDGYDVVVNKPKSAAYRAPGAPNAAFGAEQVVDEIANKLGIDPLELRLKNVATKGTSRADGTVHPTIGAKEVLQAMKNHPHYSAPLEGENSGRGVAIGYWFNIGFESAVNISVNDDGTIALTEGSTDIGGSRTSISMQAAEVLGIPAESVNPTVVDTDSIGFTFITGGSRTTFATGWAAYEAAQDVKGQLIERAAKIWGVTPDKVSYDSGVLTNLNSEEAMTFAELASELNGTGGPIIGRGAKHAGGAGAGGGSFAGVIVDLKIDPDTGKTEVTRFTSVQDAGKAIHPSYVEGQMQGGSVQGIGWALNEEYYMSDDGKMNNSTLLDYRMPTSLDLPMIDTVIVEVPSDEHPYGVRGVGEANIVPPTPAIANAIHSATGLRMERLPMNPAAIMEAKWAQG